jgi:hypothetical protein
MRCFPPFVKINPCRGVVDDYKVREKIELGGCLTPALLFVSSFFDAKLGGEELAEKMFMPEGFLKFSLFSLRITTYS